MVSFKTLFGMESAELKKVCILTPFLTKSFIEKSGLTDIRRGNPYFSGNTDHFSVICTRIGAPFVGDAVLHLKDSPCQALILFGACGLVQKRADLGFGDLVAPSNSFSFESFSDLLNGKTAQQYRQYSSDEQLTNSLIGIKNAIKPVQCASFGSFYLESKYKPLLIEKQIDVVDMECSAFFNAAIHIKRKAAGLFYVTDIIDERHVFEPLGQEDRHKLDLSTHKGIEILQALAQKEIIA